MNQHGKNRAIKNVQDLIWDLQIEGLIRYNTAKEMVNNLQEYKILVDENQSLIQG